MEFFAIGSPVLIEEDVTGKITAICIRSDNVQYEVVWWSGRSRYCEWLEPCEITMVADTQTTAIGFSPQVKETTC